MSREDEELDDEVNDIISQIKSQSQMIKQPEKLVVNLKKEDIEEFIITNAAKVVGNSVDMVEQLRAEVQAGADSKLIESVSELVKATTSAIDSLSKLRIADEKNKTQKEITQMNIDAKKTSEDDDVPKLQLTRKDVMKLLNQKDEVVVDV